MSQSSGSSGLFAIVAFAVGIAGVASWTAQNGQKLAKLAAAGPTAAPQIGLAASKDEDEDQSESPQSGGVAINASEYGHFQSTVSINGRPVDVMVDTGASVVALSYEDAERAGIYVRDADFTATARTANGVARFAPIRINDIRLGDILVHNVQGSVAERGKLSTSLLGMTFLSKLSKVEMQPNRLLLRQ